jgi:hypothetical protein
MAPVLFLFMMNAKQKGIPVLKVMATNADAIEDRQVCSHTQAMYKSKSLTMFEIFQCLYVDDGAFPFETQEDVIQGTSYTTTLHDLALTCILDAMAKNPKPNVYSFPHPSLLRQRYHKQLSQQQHQQQSTSLKLYLQQPS